MHGLISIFCFMGHGKPTIPCRLRFFAEEELSQGGDQVH